MEGLAAPALERGGQLGQIVRGVHVEHQRGQPRDRGLDPGRACRLGVPGEAVRPAGAIASGGEMRRALVPVPWRSGTMATGDRWARSPATSGGSSSGVSPGTSSTRS